MTYYTLSKFGHRWNEGHEEPPSTHIRVLAALVDLIETNNVPRTAEQIAHASEGLDVKQVREGLISLTHQGYVVEAPIPQPSDKGEIIRRTLISIEAEAERIAREEAARKRYATSEKGKATHQRYEQSDKGRAKNDRYWRDPDKGRKIHKAYRLRKGIREMEAFIATNPDKTSYVQPHIDRAKQQLAELEGA